MEAWTHCVTGPHYGDVVVSTVLSGVTLEAWTHCHRATLWCCSHKCSAYGVTLEAWTHCVTGPHYGVAVISTVLSGVTLEAWTHCVTGPHYGVAVISTVLSGVTLEAWTQGHIMVLQS